MTWAVKSNCDGGALDSGTFPRAESKDLIVQASFFSKRKQIESDKLKQFNLQAALFLQVFKHDYKKKSRFFKDQLKILMSTYCAIYAGQEFAIELYHRVDSSFHLLFSNGLELTWRKKQSVSQSVLC